MAPAGRSPGSKDSGALALVLAAGGGGRFGGDKLSARLGGRPLLDHVLVTLERARAEGVIQGGVAVIPAGAEPLRAMVLARGLTPVENPRPDEGLSGSLKRGLAALQDIVALPGRVAAMIVLGDQPLLRLEAVRRLVEAWHTGRGPIVRPRYGDRPAEPGHPVLVDREAWFLAEAAAGDAGLGPQLDAGAAVVYVDLPGANPDVDTPDDLDALAKDS